MMGEVMGVENHLSLNLILVGYMESLEIWNEA
jgi:hypothetical protein